MDSLFCALIPLLNRNKGALFRGVRCYEGRNTTTTLLESTRNSGGGLPLRFISFFQKRSIAFEHVGMKKQLIKSQPLDGGDLLRIGHRHRVGINFGGPPTEMNIPRRNRFVDLFQRTNTKTEFLKTFADQGFGRRFVRLNAAAGKTNLSRCNDRFGSGNRQETFVTLNHRNDAVS